MAHSLEEMAQAIVVCIQAGKLEEAFDVCCMALKDPKAGRDIRIYFAFVVRARKIIVYNPIIKNAVLRCLEDDGIDHQKFAVIWSDILLNDPVLGPVIEEVLKTPEPDEVFWEKNHTVFNDPYFLLGLHRFVNTNGVVERFLTKIRRLFLLKILPLQNLKTKHLDFLCALAEQCFINEYAFYLEKDEAAALQGLPEDDVYAVVIRGTYESLKGRNDVVRLSGHKAYRNLMNVQIHEPQREEEIKDELETLGAIKDAVSTKVQAQYEVNPYPRWTDVDIPLKPPAVPVKGDILIAGCGTGYFTTQVGLSFKAMDITAIDISRTSIAYAQRKAEQYGLKNIDFYQCDILDLDVLDKNFDFINCSGVLHHMNDPVAGWKKLIERLSPGGAMLIGLYSTKARSLIYELRDFVKQRGYAPDPDGIRAFRREIMDLPAKDPRKDVLRFKDFFSTSDIRDLIFHVQETTYTIPEIKSILEALDLDFVFFQMRSYKLMPFFIEKFGEGADVRNLDHWDALEQDRPYIFGEMYNFVCMKKGENMNSAMQSIVDSGILGR